MSGNPARLPVLPGLTASITQSVSVFTGLAEVLLQEGSLTGCGEAFALDAVDVKATWEITSVEGEGARFACFHDAGVQFTDRLAQDIEHLHLHVLALPYRDAEACRRGKRVRKGGRKYVGLRDLLSDEIRRRRLCRSGLSEARKGSEEQKC